MRHMMLLMVLMTFNTFAVEIILKHGEINSGQIFIPCSFDSIDYECFFDSGAETSFTPFRGFEHYKNDIKFIVGYNVIIKKNWYFDYVNSLWAMVP